MDALRVVTFEPRLVLQGFKGHKSQSVHAEGKAGNEARRGGIVTHLFECTWSPMEYPMYYRAEERTGDWYIHVHVQHLFHDLAIWKA